MTQAELDQLVARINATDDGEPGFQGAYIEKYAPPTIGIDFTDNATAEQYVFRKEIGDVKSMSVDPANGSRVLWRR